MKKRYAIWAVCALFILSCSNSNVPTSLIDVPITRTEMNSEIVKTVANISIEGMTCSSGCGGKIQQELQTLKGVKSTNLDFAENRIENIISVEYSPNLTSEKEMLNCIAAIADGKYKVAAVAIIQYKGLQGTGGGSTNNPEISSNELGNVFQLFNLLQTLSKIVE